MHDDEVKQRHAVGCRYWNTGCEDDCDCTPSIVKHLCARCNATLEVSDSSLGLVLAAHQARCFVVGDWVRWEYGLDIPGNWVEGILTRLTPGDTSINISIKREGPNRVRKGGTQTFGGLSNLRRIPRPGQEAATNCYRGGPCNMPASGGPCIDCGYPRAYARAEDVSAALEVGAVYVGGTALVIVHDHQMTPGFVRVVQRKNYECVDYPIPKASPPDPTLYDGLTAEECYIRWSTNRVHIEMHWPMKYDMTPDQISAARWVYDGSQGARHSAQLRARIAASKEAERTRVVLEQDAEDFEW